MRKLPSTDCSGGLTLMVCVPNPPHAFWKKPRSTKVGRNWQISPIKWKCTFKNQLTCSYLYLSFTWTRGSYYFGWNFLLNPPPKIKLLSEWFLQFTEIPLNALTCSTDTLAKQKPDDVPSAQWAELKVILEDPTQTPLDEPCYIFSKSWTVANYPTVWSATWKTIDCQVKDTYL